MNWGEYLIESLYLFSIERRDFKYILCAHLNDCNKHIAKIKKNRNVINLCEINIKLNTYVHKKIKLKMLIEWKLNTV